MFQSIEIPFAPSLPRFASQEISEARQYIRLALRSSNAYLLPLRLFLGLGWMRAGVSKLSDPLWYSGDELATFLIGQLLTESVAFPFYQALITDLFLPNVVTLSWLIMMGEWLVGLAIITGTVTNLALLCGIFMNVNFILAGIVSPSSFYIVIQGVLFSSNVGATLGIDALLSTRIKSIFVAAQSNMNRSQPLRQRMSRQATGEIYMGGSLDESRFHESASSVATLPFNFERACFLLIAVISAFATIGMMPHIHSYGPDSVDDPVMLLTVLSGLTCLLSFILVMRTDEASHSPLK
ncbi:MAG: hypothetical protein AAF702_41840 [Chloroflexota bacterium]